MSVKENIAIMGSTGSIGLSTLAVIDQNPERFRVFALCANSDVEGIFAQAIKYQPKFLALANEIAAVKLAEKIAGTDLDTQVLAGSQSLVELAAHEEVDTLVAAIVGSAGLASTMSAVAAGKKILLANKETLVCSGRLFMDVVANSRATLLPIDSEHNAIFQCMPANQTTDSDQIAKVYLTGSGGPFRGRRFEDLREITPDQACAHPNWSMGRKISVDSATMMNKGLELIEALWLFNLPLDKVQIVLHPQSTIHSMVEYMDGSFLAQLGSPDMKTPIAHALAWPDRIQSGAKALDILGLNLSFEEPDPANYPCLQLAIQAAKTGGSAPLVLNAANEVAVDRFLAGQIGYTEIPEIIEKVMSEAIFSEPQSIAEVIERDQSVREIANRLIESAVV